MTDADSRHAIGGNQPPALPEQVAAELPDAHRDLLARGAELAAAADRMPETIADDAMAGKFGDFKVQLRAHQNALDAVRKVVKEPYLGAGRAVDAFFQAEIARAGAKFTIIQARHTAFLTAKEARERADAQRLAEDARQRADALRAAAAAALQTQGLAAVETLIDAAREHGAVADSYAETAQGTAADLSRVRGIGSVSSLRTTVEFEIVAYAKIPLALLRAHIPRPAIEQAIRAYIKANAIKAGSAALKGVIFIERKEAQSR